jgi:curli biogenesis system outer membrane secretion channel CsgG
VTAPKFLTFLCACLLVLSGLTVTGYAQRKRQIAVLDFDFATVDIGLARRAYGSSRNLARQISDKLVTRLTGLGTVQVIERSQLERILREQRLAVTGVIDPNTMAKAGKVLGVDSLIIGNVAVFDLKGTPQPRETDWNPGKMSARIVTSFRVIDTTTAFIEASKEASGASAPSQQKAKSGWRKFMEDWANDGRRQPTPRVTEEQLKGVVEEAVDDLVSRITTELDSHFSNARQRAEEPVAAGNVLAGRVLRNNGPTVYIVNLNRSQVRRGDRLYVRRGIVERDQATGKEYKFTEKIGEVEIVEIQDELVVGSFTGSSQVQSGDIVTNSENGAGIASAVRSYTPAVPPPSPSNQAPPARAVGQLQERNLSLDARQLWQSTNIAVQPGMMIEVAATGTINLVVHKNVGPNGVEMHPHLRYLRESFPLPRALYGVVLAKIQYADGRSSTPQIVGAGSRWRIGAGESGTLWLGINAHSSVTNNGAFDVRIRW